MKNLLFLGIALILSLNDYSQSVNGRTVIYEEAGTVIGYYDSGTLGKGSSEYYGWTAVDLFSSEKHKLFSVYVGSYTDMMKFINYCLKVMDDLNDSEYVMLGNLKLVCILEEDIRYISIHNGEAMYGYRRSDLKIIKEAMLNYARNIVF